MPIVHVNREYPTSVHAKTAELIRDLNPAVEQQVIDTLVNVEKNRRASAIVQVLDMASRLENDLNRIRPTHNHFDIDGKGIGEPGFTKDQFEKRKSLKEKIQKRFNAVNKALEKGDYSDVYNLANSDGKNSEGSE